MSKVVAVTGANKGIGYEIVKSLCSHFRNEIEKDQVTVYLTARDKTRGTIALNQLLKEGLHPKLYILDIECEENVKEYADFLKHNHGGLSILINNASISYFTNPKADLKEQAENTIRVNYFGTLSVCSHLFPLLRANSRVVNISSGLGHLTKINAKRPGAEQLKLRFGDPNLTEEQLTALVNEYLQSVRDGTHMKEGWPNSAYAVSKIAICALTRIQQKEMNATRPDEDIIINSVHPGWVKSDMTGGRGLYSTEEGAVAPTLASLIPPNNTDSPKGAFIWREMTLVDWVNGPLPSTF